MGRPQREHLPRSTDPKGYQRHEQERWILYQTEEFLLCDAHVEFLGGYLDKLFDPFPTECKTESDQSLFEKATPREASIAACFLFYATRSGYVLHFSCGQPLKSSKNVRQWGSYHYFAHFGHFWLLVRVCLPPAGFDFEAHVLCLDAVVCGCRWLMDLLFVPLVLHVPAFLCTHISIL